MSARILNGNAIRAALCFAFLVSQLSSASEPQGDSEKHLQDLRRKSIVVVEIAKAFECVDIAAIHVMLSRGYKVHEDHGEEVAWIGESSGLVHREVRLRIVGHGPKTTLRGRVYGVISATGEEFPLIAEKDVDRLRKLVDQIKAKAESQPCAFGDKKEKPPTREKPH